MATSDDQGPARLVAVGRFDRIGHRRPAESLHVGGLPPDSPAILDPVDSYAPGTLLVQSQLPHPSVELSRRPTGSLPGWPSPQRRRQTPALTSNAPRPSRHEPILADRDLHPDLAAAGSLAAALALAAAEQGLNPGEMLSNDSAAADSRRHQHNPRPGTLLDLHRIGEPSVQLPANCGPAVAGTADDQRLRRSSSTPPIS